jgi:hypothetical protein
MATQEQEGVRSKPRQKGLFISSAFSSSLPGFMSSDLTRRPFSNDANPRAIYYGLLPMLEGNSDLYLVPLIIAAAIKITAFCRGSYGSCSCQGKNPPSAKAKPAEQKKTAVSITKVPGIFFNISCPIIAWFPGYRNGGGNHWGVPAPIGRQACTVIRFSS